MVAAFIELKVKRGAKQTGGYKTRWKKGRYHKREMKYHELEEVLLGWGLRTAALKQNFEGLLESQQIRKRRSR